MRKRSIVLLFAIAAMFVAIPARAQMEDADGKKWTVHGDIRVRGDYFENYDFADVDNGGVDDNGVYWPYTVRVGITGDVTENIRAMVDFRVDSSFGSSPTFNEFGSGTPQFFSSAFSSEDNINVYQGWVEFGKLFGWESFSARLGRQEHTYGTEFLMGDNDFYTGQSFDGLRLMWLNPKWDLNLFYYKLVENNFNNPNLFLGVIGGSQDTNMFGATFDWKMDKWGTVGANYIRYQGLDDTSPFVVFPGSGIDTIGIRWENAANNDDMFDWNIEFQDQSGDFGNDPVSTDISADALEAWFGFTFHSGSSHHRFHIGYLNASGNDSDPTENEAFFPLFDDNHAYNRLGNLDNFIVSNIEDVNIGYTGRFADDKHTIMVAIHQLALDEPITTGPGATEDDLGMAWDLNYMYAMNSNLGFEVNVSQGQSGDVQDFIIGNADTAARYYAQVHLRW